MGYIVTLVTFWLGKTEKLISKLPLSILLIKLKSENMGNISIFLGKQNHAKTGVQTADADKAATWVTFCKCLVSKKLVFETGSADQSSRITFYKFL